MNWNKLVNIFLIGFVPATFLILLLSVIFLPPSFWVNYLQIIFFIVLVPLTFIVSLLNLIWALKLKKTWILPLVLFLLYGIILVYVLNSFGVVIF